MACPDKDKDKDKDEDKDKDKDKTSDNDYLTVVILTKVGICTLPEITAV
ncbi:hypothetical protein [Thalassotalea litorea]|nr:hypothetical protein [Thalassotalea litorea]